MPAFVVRGDECSDIVFGPDLETVEQNLENGYYMDMEEAEPAPQYDQFEQAGKVPKSVLLLDGWWFRCYWCDHKIDSDLEAPLVDEEDGDSDSDGWRKLEPVEVGSSIYCSQNCLDEDRNKAAKAEATRHAAKEQVLRSFPGVVITNCWGGYHDDTVRVSFKAPGLKFPVDYSTDDPDHVKLCQIDVPAWKQFKASIEANQNG